MSLDLAIEARCGAARTGVVSTARGSFATPCFMPVGTRGTVKALSSTDVDQLGFEVVLANTYHLMLRPGAEVIESLGGVGRFSGWDQHTLTDSGGFQVFSLSPHVDDDGVTFRSTYDGSLHRLTPEAAVDIQHRLGADIQMVLDVCPPLPSPAVVVETAVRRTREWAARARDAHRWDDQAIFGIVQGGTDVELRASSAKATVDIGFDGYGIGGLSVGESRPDMLRALDAAIAELPAERPRYLMGVGDPLGLVEAVARGVDMLDCVLPTRLGRHGTALTEAGRYQLRRADNATDSRPIDTECDCPVCARWSRGYLRHLLAVGEPSASRLVSIHNLAFMARLVRRTRAAIASGTLDSLRADVAAVWG
jgi:queuine tRNA-ribosyltransferase